MLDPTRTPVVRDYNQQELQYYRLTINFNDPGVATGIAFGALPRGTFITQITSHVVTAFNAVTTNVITIGTTKANANEIVASGAIAPGTPGFANLTTAAGLGLAVTNAAATTLYYKYTQTGTAATAGQAVVVIVCCLPNDQ